MMRRVCGCERGMALVVVLMVLIVVSLGIIALTNGVANMHRAPTEFARSDEAYNAATAGLNVVRGYLNGLAYDTATPSVLPQGTVGTATYNVAIAYTSLAPESTADGKTTWYRRIYTVTSTGACEHAKRILQQSLTLIWERRDQEVVTEWEMGDYGVLSSGSLDINGNVTVTNVHTNADLSVKGASVVLAGSAHGLATGRPGLVSHAPLVAIPEVPWDKLAMGDYGTYVVPPGTDLKKLDPSAYAGKHNIYVKGNVKMTGGTINANLFVDGNLDIAGSATINGIVYCNSNDMSYQSFSSAGTAAVHGGIIARGPARCRGTFDQVISTERRNAANAVLQTTTTVSTYTTTIQEGSGGISDVPA